jgi:hypothetical protein
MCGKEQMVRTVKETVETSHERQQIAKDRTITCIKPDITLRGRKEKYTLIEVSLPTDNRVVKKGAEK